MIRFSLFLIVLVCTTSFSQHIEGTLVSISNKEIILSGYEGLELKKLTSTTTDSIGHFSMNYPANFIGAALLQIKDKASIIVLLNKENFSIKWDNVQDSNSIQFIQSYENKAFTEGMRINNETEQKLAGLKFLLPLYTKNSKEYRLLKREIAIQEAKFTFFLNNLPQTSYVKTYLKIRKLIADIPFTANRYIERFPQHEKDFTSLNFDNDALWNSGLLKDLFESYYQLTESLLQPNEIFIHCNLATDAWITKLAANPARQQEIAELTFKWLEKRSLFGPAEYVAKSMLNQTNCQIDQKRTNLFEQYRKMAIGNIAPDIVLNPDNKDKSSLKELKNSYKLVVFGASWCSNCQANYPKLIEKYNNLKNKYNIEIVYISLDNDRDAFKSFYREAPFITFFDGQGWETKAAKEYYIFATPTYILLNKDLMILAKIQSPEHLEAWLEAHN